MDIHQENDGQLLSSDASEQQAHDAEDFTQRKRSRILAACQTRNLEALVDLATTDGGLLQDELRRVAWPILLGYSPHSSDPSSNCVRSWQELPQHSDESQVKLDVDRAFVHYPNCSDKELATKKEELLALITAVLRQNPMLCYFQGYHDIAQVFLLVLGPANAELAVERVSLFRIRDYMLPSLSPALKHLQLLPAILDSADRKLSRHISGTKPFFALATTLTLYAHDVQNLRDIARLYDFILSHEPVVSVYLFAAIILSRKAELYDIEPYETDMIHFTLTKLPQPLRLEPLISDAMSLYRSFPPESLPYRAWQSISAHSVLKSSRDLAVNATREDAERLFQRQTRELRWEERRQKVSILMRKHSHSIGSIGLAVLIAVISYLVMKGDTETSLVWRFWRVVRLSRDMLTSFLW
ncbi:hypothetical protein VTO42DRAFT_6017 [Malbranchea cinnamomea]